MGSYTDIDLEASGRFAETNNMIRIIRRMHEKVPHLTSWLKINIRDVTPDDYYVPATLEHAAKIITVDFDENICQLLSCTPNKEQDTCKPNDEASYYYVGDDSYDVQCQPACYHTASKITLKDDGSRAVDIPRLSWNEKHKECRFVNSHVVNLLEKPFYRSDVKFEKRVNDMPTGFSRIVNPNEFSVGYTYTMNETYCRYYDRTLTDTGECSYTLMEKFLDAVIGMTLINYVKSGIRMLVNNNIPFPLPTNLPILPPLKKEHTLDGWLSNINKDFVLPELIDTKPRQPTAKSYRTKRSTDPTYNDDDDDDDDDGGDDPMSEKRNLHEKRRKAELESMVDMSNFMRIQLGLNVNIDETKIMGLNENNEILEPFEEITPKRTKRDATPPVRGDGGDDGEFVDSEKENESGSNPNTSTGGNEKDDEKNNDIPHYKEVLKPSDMKWYEKVKFIFLTILQGLTDEKFYENIGIDIGVQIALRKLKSFSIKVIEKMSGYMARGFTEVVGSIGYKALTAAFKGVATYMVANMAMRICAKSTIFLAKILSAAASLVGWLLVGTMILDLVFAIWDPLGYNQMFPPNAPKDLMDSGEYVMRQSLGTTTGHYKFENLVMAILSEDELIELQLPMMVDRLIYLDALTVNSDGVLIDKGREINVQSGTKFQFDVIRNNAMAERVKFNARNYEIYNDRFMTRISINKYLNYIAASAVILGAVCLIARLPLITFVVVIIAVIILAISRLELYDDILVDLVDKYKNKESKVNPNHAFGYAIN